MSSTKANDPRRASELAIIHIAKNAHCEKDDDYRAILKAQANGKTSSATLTPAERRAVINYFKKQFGFETTTTKAHQKPKVAKDKQPLIDKIGAQLFELKAEWAYADGIAKQMFNIAKVQWCDCGQLRSIVVALTVKVKTQEKSNAKTET